MKQFIGLSLADFYQHDSKSEKEIADSKIAKIKDPSKNSNKDFIATLETMLKHPDLHFPIHFNQIYSYIKHYFPIKFLFYFFLFL